MRIFMAAVTVALAVVPHPIVAQTRICGISGECQKFMTPEEAERYMRSVEAARAEQARAVAQTIPIDYRDCIVVALADEMTSDKTQHYFVEDMDTHLQGKLRQHGIRALPASAFPPKWQAIQNRSRRTPYWQFSFAFTSVTIPGKEFQASVGFSCGTLCLSRTTYVLKVAGNACEIVSKQWEGGA